MKKHKEKGRFGGFYQKGMGGGRGKDGGIRVLKLRGIPLKSWSFWVENFFMFLVTDLGRLGFKNLIPIEMKSCELKVQF